MDYKKRWKIMKELGAGGQGKVYQVLDTRRFQRDPFNQIAFSIERMPASREPEEKKRLLQDLCKSVVDLVKMEDPANHGALKVLHDLKDARDPERAQDRIRNEMKAMARNSHPNLLRILDCDSEGKWFVSQFHPRGSLQSNRGLFTGDVLGALKAFRNLVDGVSELHKKGIVHRDIKPQNVFVNSHNNLVLGDFGLVFFVDSDHTRISGTFENVGTRDWMPAWAMGMRIEDVKPTFDVFSLGKLLWAMISKSPVLQLWYYRKPEFNVEAMFPKAPNMRFANALFKKTIVEEEKHCLPDATAFLDEIERVLALIEKNADLVLTCISL